MADTTNLRKEIAGSFRKHCENCTGACCGTELEEGYVAFGWEPGGVTDGVLFVPFTGGKCRHSGSRACRLDLSDRPLDCLSYPVYPVIKIHDDGSREVEGLRVRRDCPSAEEISKDAALLGLVKEFWRMSAGRIPERALKEWFSDREYWSGENFIKA